MACGNALRGGRGGGESIQAPRSHLPRLGAGALSLAIAAGLAVWPVVGSGAWVWLLAPLGVAACLLLAAGLLVRFAGAVAWPVALLGTEYAASIEVAEKGFDGRAGVVGAGLLAVAELSYWAVERAWVPSDDPPRRLAFTALLVVGATGVSSLVLALAAVRVTGGVPLEALGVAAAVGTLAVIAWLARSGAADGA